MTTTQGPPAGATLTSHPGLNTGRWSRRRVFQLAAWVAILIGLSLLALRFSAPLWIGHNGDHAYYTAMALQYGNVEYDRSLRKVAQFFDYPDWSRTLDYGFFNPVVAPLIYPRPVYPLLATLPMHVLGMKAVYLPGLAAGAVATVAIVVLVLRQTRSVASLLVLPLLLSTYLFTEFVFGIYTDAFVVAFVALIMLALPWTGRTTWARVITVCALSACMLLSRQVPLVPLAIVGGGWLWTAVRGRRVTNEWFRYLVAVFGTTLVTYLLLSQWAPYDPTAFMRMKTETSSTSEAFSQIWELLDYGLTIDAGFVWNQDKFVLPVFILSLVGLWLCRHKPLAGVYIGLLAAGFVTTSLNGANTEFRYMTPAIPAAAMLIGEVFARVWRLVSANKEAQPPRPETLDGTDRRSGRFVRAAAIFSTVGLVAIVVGTVAVHQPAPLRDAPRLHVSAAMFPTWPLAVTEGTLVCAGDNRQVWFESPDGTLYAASGSAMARSFFRPRITELAVGDVAYAWPDFGPILTTGVQLCAQ